MLCSLIALYLLNQEIPANSRAGYAYINAITDLHFSATEIQGLQKQLAESKDYQERVGAAYVLYLHYRTEANMKVVVKEAEASFETNSIWHEYLGNTVGKIALNDCDQVAFSTLITLKSDGAMAELISERLSEILLK
ncbi:MAG: hypothetical protein KDC26_03320 [Armatimonadetes bacterium]|nr:hypothetical protein [Armatimonadota bacterium]